MTTSTEDSEPESEGALYDGPSKSERKRQHKALQEFTAALVIAPENQLAKLALPKEVNDDIRSARKMSRGALNRQIGFISKRMSRDMSWESIDLARTTFEAFKHPSAAANAHFHKLEDWRAALIKGDNGLMEQLVDELGADRQQLRRLVREALKQQERDASPTASRQLFQYLRKLSGNR